MNKIRNKYINFLVIGSMFAFLFVVNINAQSSNDWVRIRNNKIPSDAVEGGYERNGEKTYICRVRYQGSYIGGRGQFNQCFYNTGSGESSASRFEVLVGKGYRWSYSKNYDRAVAVGGNDFENYYVCRVKASGGLYPGRTEDGRCYYTRDRRGYSSSSYEVLSGDRDNINLLYAASRGDYQAVRNALRDGQAINQIDSYGRTALMLASEKGYERVVRELLYERVAIDQRDKKGNTALMLAASNGHRDIFRDLMRTRADLTARNDEGDTAFTLAAAGGHTGIVTDLLNDKNDGVEMPDAERGLRNAAFGGHTDILRILMNYGVNIESKDFRDGRTALMLAAMGRKANTVRFLLDNDANINAQDIQVWTPFLYGVKANSEDVLRVFMEEKELIRADDFDAENGLRLAAVEKNNKVVSYLLLRGVDVNSTDSAGNTALMVASEKGRDKTILLLINANADLNIQNNMGETALMLAAANSRKKTAQNLVKAGANLNIRDNNGITALGWAIRNKHKDTRRVLQKAGAKQ